MFKSNLPQNPVINFITTVKVANYSQFTQLAQLTNAKLEDLSI
jgi:hypothetical protein